MSGALAGRIIVIIGGTSGLGLSAAQACVDAGAKIVAIGRDETDVANAAASLGSSASVFAADATHPSSAPAAIDRAIKQFGGFHGLYHVAGGSGRKFGDGPLHELTDEGWNATLHLNLTSVMVSNRAAVRQFLKQGSGGSVLNMGSVLGFSPSPRFFA